MLLLCSIAANAIPACPDITTVMQPDGSEISLRLHGDEFLNWTTTDDDYTVVVDAAGYYVYATEANGKLVPSGIKAHSADKRTTNEKEFLSKAKKNLKPAPDASASKRRQEADHLAQSSPFQRQYDYTKFRGLVILVEYNDCPFSRSDAHELFDEMINKPNYDGYMTDAMIQEKVPCTGSVRDYFYDNSHGIFDPHFDVVGPVKIDYSQYDAHAAQYAQLLVKAALNAADDQVDFSLYDTDGDKEVEMVYFIFSGGGSNFSGNSSSLIWPHASSFVGTFDGVQTGRYACSTELYGKPASKIIDGIGTICHEFSHILGLKDEYDTDGSGSGGECPTPSRWSLMAQGSYLNKSRTPCGYSLFERYQSGFATPTTIEETGDYTLTSIDESNTGYRINSAIENEYFLLENRRKTKWNEYLPGEGMLVFRVDSTDVSVWTNNDINCNPAHSYYELLRANPTISNGSIKDSDGDPFPGSGNIVSLTNATSPSLRSWTSVSTPLIIKNISETNGEISFTIETDDHPTDIEDFESMTPTSGDATRLQGKFCSWDLENATIAAPEEGWCSGKQAVAMVKKGQITSSELPDHVKQLSYSIYNYDPKASSMTTFRCYYSTNGGATWTPAKTIEGIENVTAESMSTTKPIYNLDLEEPAKFRIVEYTGSASAACYVDDITFTYDQRQGSASNIKTDNSSLKASAEGNTIHISGASAGATIRIFDSAGALVGITTASPEGTASIAITGKGFYMLTDGTHNLKLLY